MKLKSLKHVYFTTGNMDTSIFLNMDGNYTTPMNLQI